MFQRLSTKVSLKETMSLRHAGRGIASGILPDGIGRRDCPNLDSPKDSTSFDPLVTEEVAEFETCFLKSCESGWLFLNGSS